MLGANHPLRVSLLMILCRSQLACLGCSMKASFKLLFMIEQVVQRYGIQSFSSH